MLEDEHVHGTLAAMIQISVIFTTFVFVMDIVCVYFTLTNDLIAYDSNSAFYLSTVTGLVIDVGAFAWVLIVLIASCQWGCRNFLYNLQTGAQTQSSTRVKKLFSTVTVAPMLCLANHIQYIIIAFISDPFHAGSIAIMYTLSFFLYYFVFRQFYNRMVLQSNKRPKIVPRLEVCKKCSAKERLWNPPLHDSKGSTDRLTEDYELQQMGNNSTDNKCNCFIPGPNCHTPFNTKIVVIGLLVVGPFVTFYQAIMIILFFSLPITKSIEDAPSRIYTIYQGTGLIIVALLTYNILLNPKPFSLTKVVERLAKRFHLPEHTNFWNRLSHEEKCSKLIVTLLESHFQSTSGKFRCAKKSSDCTQEKSEEDLCRVDKENTD